jgi:antitoxin component YwqK of YwqJK toxin-antitoxin module
VTRKLKIYFVFVALVTLAACSNEVEDKEITQEEECMNCNDIFLDPMYNHFYTEDRTEPFTGKCKGYNKKGDMILEKNFVAGKLEGEYFEYYDDGTLKSEWNFLKNRQHGDFKGYSPNGYLQYHSVYYKGDLDSTIYP